MEHFPLKAGDAVLAVDIQNDFAPVALWPSPMVTRWCRQ
jgi:hypothetical protein